MTEHDCECGRGCDCMTNPCVGCSGCHDQAVEEQDEAEVRAEREYRERWGSEL